jgi:SAM-dependent methyltransferase
MQKRASESLQHVPCYLCESTLASAWAEEAGYEALRCGGCGLVYVSPRPPDAEISDAVALGMHGDEEAVLSTVSGGIEARRVEQFRRRLVSLLGNTLGADPVVRWLDVGAGYGEFVLAVRKVVHAGSSVEGIEPCEPKARWAETHHGFIRSGRTLGDCPGPFDVVSLMNVLSHLPEPVAFIHQLSDRLEAGGHLILETGNGAELDRSAYPGPLFLPDHLSFFGEPQLVRLLEGAGLRVVRIERHEAGSSRLPLIAFARNQAMNLVRRLRGKAIHRIDWSSYALCPRSGAPFVSIWLLAQKLR